MRTVPMYESGTPVADKHATPLRQPSRTIEYRLIYALVFMVFLVAGSIWYLLMLGFLREQTRGQGPWSEARAAADNSVPYVFRSQ